MTSVLRVGSAGPQLGHEPAHVARDAVLVRRVVCDAVLVDPFVDDRAVIGGARVAWRGWCEEGGQQRREKHEAGKHARDSSGPPTPRQGNAEDRGCRPRVALHRARLRRRARPRQDPSAARTPHRRSCTCAGVQNPAKIVGVRRERPRGRGRAGPASPSRSSASRSGDTAWRKGRRGLLGSARARPERLSRCERTGARKPQIQRPRGRS